MRILYIHDRALDKINANVLQVLNMCHALSEAGADVTLFVPESKEMNKPVEKFINEQFLKPAHFSIKTFHNITIARRFTMVGGYWGVVNAIKRETCDYCFVRNPVYLNAPLGKGFRTVFESHGAEIHKNKTLNLLWKMNLIQNCLKPNLVGFVAISQRLADFWTKKGVPKEKVLTLHDGVDLNAFQDIPDLIEAKKKLSLSLDKKTVIYAGNLFKNREVDIILRLAAEIPYAEFVTLGFPVERVVFFEQLVKKHKIANARFLGPIPYYHVKDYLFAADVLLMIFSNKVRTINYCSPLKMFEYMAAAKIIVGHDFPTIKEVLTHEVNALLTSPDSYNDLKENLIRALRMDYPNYLADNARRLALDKYSWQKRASEILDNLSAIHS